MTTTNTTDIDIGALAPYLETVDSGLQRSRVRAQIRGRSIEPDLPAQGRQWQLCIA